MRRSPGLRLACSLSLFGANAIATHSSESEVDGKMLLQKYCNRCHSIDATSQSPLQLAPPLREIYLRYPIEQLEYGFAEGMGAASPRCSLA